MRHHHGEQISIDSYAYESRLREVNPTFKLLFSLAVIAVCIGFDNVSVSMGILLVMSFLVTVRGGMDLRNYLSVLTTPFVFILLGTIAIGFDLSMKSQEGMGGRVLFFYMYTSVEQIKNMGFLMAKVFAAVSALQFLILTTPASEVIGALSRLHLPKLIVELMHMIYRYIFILLDVHGKMKNAALSRGGYNSYKGSLRTFGSIAGNLFIIAMKKAGNYYDAMEARCYDGELNFLEEEKPVKWQQTAWAAAFLLGLAALKLAAGR